MSSDESDNEAQRELAYKKLIESNLKNQNPKKINKNIWTNYLQDDEISSMLTSGQADICENNQFASDEFKRYDAKNIDKITTEYREKKNQAESQIQSFGRKNKCHHKNHKNVYHANVRSAKNSNSYRPKFQGKRTSFREDPMTHIKVSAKIPVGEKFYLNKRIENLNVELSDDEFISEICYRLREPNRRFIKDIVDIIGKEAAIKYYNETEQIELAGGIPAHDTMKPADEKETNEETKNPRPNRRKTAGGIFITLIYSNPKLDPGFRIKLAAVKKADIKRGKEQAKIAKARSRALSNLRSVPRVKKDFAGGVTTSSSLVKQEEPEDGMESGECSD